MTQLNGELADLRIRPYGIKDGTRLRAMSGRLSPKSLYLRFFSGSPRVPETYVRSLDTMDHWHHDALVALDQDDLVGIAEYVRLGCCPDRAELATLIADDWQRRGLGRCLITMLAELALRRGISGFDAAVMLENRRGLLAIHQGWPSAIPEYEDGAAHYRLPLPVPERRPVPETSYSSLNSSPLPG